MESTRPTVPSLKIKHGLWVRCCISKEIASCDSLYSKVQPLLSGEMRVEKENTVKVHFAIKIDKNMDIFYRIEKFLQR